MLASRSAWAILRKEHAQIREMLDSIAQAVQGGQWREGGPALAKLKERIDALQTFDLSVHRPKGVALTEMLRGRSAESDRLLAMLVDEREHDDTLLYRVLLQLDALAGGDASPCADCEALLAQHRECVLRHLEQEDTLLCDQTEQLLTEEEWSRVVSAISSALYPQKDVPPPA